MLGLKRYTVALVEHHSEWSAYATNRCQKIRYACRDHIVDIQHVGSTSIPDIPAKPIIDIAIGVQDLNCIEDLKEILQSMSYIYRGVGEGSSGHLFVRESGPDIRTEHIHVNIAGSSHWENHIGFRDIMRSNSSLRKEYADLKKELARRFSEDRKSYTHGKHDFIQKALNLHHDTLSKAHRSNVSKPVA
jgi:GrpB-like predicted nucleotidyltransferase (UPF0157 family)